MGNRVVLFAAFLILSPAYAEAFSSHTYRVFFPSLNLSSAKFERIAGFTLTIPCGHVEAIEEIPGDWDVHLIAAVSAVEVLEASAGHGTSMPYHLDVFDGSILINDGGSSSVDAKGNSCFDISAKIRVSSAGGGREIRLRKSALKLVPAP